MSTAVSCWEWILGARQDLELQVSPSSCLYHLLGGTPTPWGHSKDLGGTPTPLGPFKGLNCHTWEIHPQSENYVYNFFTQVNLTLIDTLACIANVSLWFGSKERPRNGILCFGRVKNEPPLPALLLAPLFTQSLTLVPRSFETHGNACYAGYGRTKII